MAEGNMSLEDCEALTWSLGWTADPGQRSVARVARTSFMFMFDEVPEPVWNTSIGNSSSHSPLATSWAAALMATATFLSTSFSRAFSRAAAPLSRPGRRSATARCVKPEMGKLSTARWVWA